jgi:hypothetical protein
MALRSQVRDLDMSLQWRIILFYKESHMGTNKLLLSMTELELEPMSSGSSSHPLSSVLYYLLMVIFKTFRCLCLQARGTDFQ